MLDFTNFKGKIMFRFLIVLICLSILPLSAQENTFRMIIAKPIGQIDDVYGRIISEELKKELNAQVVVENKPGGGSAIGIKYYSMLPKTGLNLLSLDTELAISRNILKSEEMHLPEFEFLGRITYSPRLLVVRKDSKVSSIEEIVKNKDLIFMGAPLPDSNSAQFGLIFCWVMDLKCKMVYGYTGEAELALGLKRKEIDAFAVNESKAVEIVETNDDLKIISTVGTQPSPENNIPPLTSLIELSPEKLKVLKFREDISFFGNTFVIHKDAPAEYKTLLRRAINKILNDKEFVERLSKLKLSINYSNSRTFNEMYKNINNESRESEKEQLKRLLYN
jgi:tripartite-type tricarboxylate transporter receptor subunit TctC